MIDPKLRSRRCFCWCAAGAAALWVFQLAACRAQQPTAADDADDAVEIPVRLLDRPPFDRVTLDAANDNAVIETVLLDLPARRVPDNLPREGELSLHRLSEPSISYAVPWSAVVKIELYEQMLLDEANRLTAANQFEEAFEYLAYLRTNYADLPGLESAMQAYLWKEASTTFAAGQRDEAWPILLSLYARNPEYPRLDTAPSRPSATRWWLSGSRRRTTPPHGPSSTCSRKASPSSA